MAVHIGSAERGSVTEPEVAPIYASAVFKFGSLEQVEDVWMGKSRGMSIRGWRTERRGLRGSG